MSVHRSGAFDTQSQSADPSVFRVAALIGVALLIGSFVSVLYGITAIVGESLQLLSVVAFFLLVATVLSNTLESKEATAIGGVLFVLGLWIYLHLAAGGISIVFTAGDRLLSDVITLATGLPLNRMIDVHIWALGFAPAPAFLTWYFALNRRYVLSVIPGGLTLLFLVLTSDAGLAITLIGTVGAILAVGCGELERYDGTVAQADVLVVFLTVIIVLSLTVSVVPAGTYGPAVIVSDEPETLEDTVMASPDSSAISGSVELSPEVRFSIRSEEPAYWRTGVYDRYIGDEWVRTGEPTEYDGSITSPARSTETVRQTVLIEDAARAMPTAPHPIAIEGQIVENTLVGIGGQPLPDGQLIPGDTYNVRSAVPDADSSELADAGTHYPEEITDRYLQTPSGISSEFEEVTAEIVDDAESPYDAAGAIEDYLRSNYRYSLEVTKPEGDVADAFLLEMEAGYCVYFATTMVQMLRTQDIPARYVTGYTTGQQIDDNEWVVRGLDAHAWVEVYFPAYGWVAFDPTPPADRSLTHTDRLEEARERGEAGIDTPDSSDVPVDGMEEESIDVPTIHDGTATNETAENITDRDYEFPFHPDEYDQYGPGMSPEGPDRLGDFEPIEDDIDDEDEPEETGIVTTAEELMLGAAILIGIFAGAHHVGFPHLIARRYRLLVHGRRSDPVTDIERSFDRIEIHLSRQYSPRESSETPRQYIDRLRRFGLEDDRIDRIRHQYERATYARTVEKSDADEVISLTNAVIRGRSSSRLDDIG